MNFLGTILGTFLGRIFGDQVPGEVVVPKMATKINLFSQVDTIIMKSSIREVNMKSTIQEIQMKETKCL